MAAGSPLSPRKVVARYPYRSPPVPKPGNRSEAERRLAQGVRAQERNRLSEAMEEYRQATIADPSFGDAYYNLGVAAYEAGDLAQCLSAYEYTLAISPASPKARFNFAVALQKANYPRDAAGELERLLADNASETRAHFMLANLYAQQLGEPARAREHYLRLLELEPQHPQATAIRYWLEANP
jgi:tetratricopeptide (TPR) repeat protein